MGSNPISVTRFKADNIHIDEEPLPSMEPLPRRPQATFARNYMSQIRPNADILPINGICGRVRGAVGEGVNSGRVGIDSINGSINSARNWSQNEINSVRNYANQLSRSGMSDCNLNAISNPSSFISNLRNSVFGQVRSLANLNLRIDDLLIGSTLRSQLVRLINGVCGLSINDPFGGVLGAIRDLLNILDNPGLFSNSDLLSAIARCAHLTSDHSRALSARTTGLAADGNVVAIRDIVVNIPDTRVTSEDLVIVAATAEDIDTNNTALIQVYNTTGRSTSSLISSKVNDSISLVKTEDTPAKKVIDMSKISTLQNKPKLLSALLQDNNIKRDARVIAKTAELTQPIVTIRTAKGTKVLVTSDKEKIILKNTTNKVFGPIDKKIKEYKETLVSNDKNPEINMGMIITTANHVGLQEERPRKSISSTVPEKWYHVPKEGYSKAEVSAFQEIDEETYLKINNNKMVITESETDNILVNFAKKRKISSNISNNLNPIQNIGTVPPCLKGCIKGFKSTVQPDGNVLRVAIY